MSELFTGESETTKEMVEDDQSATPKTSAMVKKGQDCIVMAEIVCSDLIKGTVEGVEQKLKGLKGDAEKLAKHAEEKVKEIEQMEEKHEIKIIEIQRQIGELACKLEELQAQKESTLSSKQSLLSQRSSELSSAENRLSNVEYDYEKEKREAASRVGGGAVLGAFIGTLLAPGVETAFGAAAGAGAGKVISDSDVRDARGRVDDCRRWCDDAQAEVSSASSAVSNAQSQINSLPSQCQELERKSRKYNEEANKMKKAVLFLRKASQFWKEFQSISEDAANRTTLLQRIIGEIKEKKNFSWLNSSSGRMVGKTFLDAWEMVKTKCEQGVNYVIFMIE